MDGMRGYRGWRWVFILGAFNPPALDYPRLTVPEEGVFTCVVGVLFYFIISDFPEEALWLTQEKRDFVKARLHEDVGASHRHKPLSVKDTLNIIKECKCDSTSSDSGNT